MPQFPHKIFILPFDHRSSFIRSFIDENFTDDDLCDKDIKLIKNYKKIIYEGFLLALKKLPKSEKYGILVDNHFGDQVIRLAKRKKNITVATPTEKSGQRYFHFEHGKDFAKHIEKVNPDIVKVLVRYNPRDKTKANDTQLRRLHKLSRWCRDNNRVFMVELLVPPLPVQKKKPSFRQVSFDKKSRPHLTLATIRRFHSAGIDPDIWKIEAMESKSDWPDIIAEIRDTKERKDVAIILLGRGASFAKIKHWFSVAPKNELNGFVVGRTVFLRPLEDMHAGRIKRSNAVKEIAGNFEELYRLWNE